MGRPRPTAPSGPCATWCCTCSAPPKPARRARRTNTSSVRRGSGPRPMIAPSSTVSAQCRLPNDPHIADADIPARVRGVFPDALNGRTNIPAAGSRERHDARRGPRHLGDLEARVPHRPDPHSRRLDASGRHLACRRSRDGAVRRSRRPPGRRLVAEWARRHGRPFTLELGGPAGGTFIHGVDGEEIAVDAIEFCRIVSGRAPGAGLLTQEVAF